MRKPQVPLPTLLVLASLVLSAIAQDQAPALVSGIVVNAASNAPLPGVLVMMTGGGVATTDNRGLFTLKDVLPGTWTIQALRTGMAPPVRDSVPRVITIKPGEEIRDVRLWLAPLATLRGRISDPDGKPLSGVRVEPLVVGYQAGKRVLQIPENASINLSLGTTTGVDGDYEFQLPGGRYYVAATYSRPAQPRVIAPINSPVTVSGTTRTYYPGTLDSELAATVMLTAGGTAIADFKVYLESPVGPKISGTIIGARTGLTTLRFFRLVPRNVPGYIVSGFTIPDFRRYAQTIGVDGFEISGAARGSYTLIVDDTMTDGRTGYGVVDIEVGSQDIKDLVIVLQPGQDVEGKVILRSASNTIALDQVAIRGGPPVVMAAADGTFTLRSVSEGAHSIRVDGLPVDAYVADIRQGTVSLFDSARTLDGPEYIVSGSYAVPLEVTVSPNGGVIDGVVQGAANQSVAGSIAVLIPGPTRRFVQSYYRTAFVGATGEFTFQGLAPGVYQLYAWESVPNTAWLNPDFIASYEGRGESVSVESGKRQSVRVRLIARED